MKERPIIFNDEMVRAILDGRKTVTRRPVKFELNNLHKTGNPVMLLGDWPLSKVHGIEDNLLKYDVQIDVDDYYSATVKCPFGKIADRLYVREGFTVVCCESGYDNGMQQSGNHDFDFGGALVKYRSDESTKNFTLDGDDPEKEDREAAQFNDEERWFPSIHMPKWAARIWLEITDVRVDRVQDITEEQAKAEGVSLDMAYQCNGWGPTYNDPDSGGDPYYTGAFEYLWGSIYDNWHQNPWVWVIEFKRIDA